MPLIVEGIEIRDTEHLQEVLGPERWEKFVDTLATRLAEIMCKKRREAFTGEVTPSEA